MKLRTAYKLIITGSILLPALIVAFFGITGCFGFYAEMVNEETAYAAYSEAKSHEIFFDRYSARLSAMAELDQIKHAAGGDYTAIKNQVDAVLNSSTDSAVKDIIVIDNNGRVVINLQESLNLTTKVFEGYDDPLAATAADGIYVSPIYVDNQNYGANIIYMAKPVKTPAGSIGYIAAAVDAEQLRLSFADSAFFGGAGSIIFVDGAGTAVSTSGIGSSDIRFTPDMLSLVNETNRYVPFSESGYYGAYGVIENTDWAWVGMCKASAMNLSLFPGIMYGLALLAAVILIDVLMAFVIYRRTVFPLGNIANAMAGISAGDRSKRLPAFKTYEHQIISGTFNKLLDDFCVSEDVQRAVSLLTDSMLFDWDADQRKMYVSDNFRDMFNIDVSRASLPDGGFIDAVMNEKDAKRFHRDMSSLPEKREYVEGEYQVKTVRNTEIWINIRAEAHTDEKDSESTNRILGVITDINNRKKTSLQLSQKVSRDLLTGLYNGTTFLTELQKLLHMKRTNENYAVLFIDVDDFRFINDRYGYDVGDEVIGFTADTLKECVDKGGIVGRFGGDEFVLCITDSEAVSHYEDFVAKITDKLYAGFKCKTVGTTLNIKASIGITFANEQASEAEVLIGQADEAIYFVKKNFKSGFHVYDPATTFDLDLGNAIT